MSWLDEARSNIEADPARIRSLFPAAGRGAGRGPLPGRESHAGDVFAWTVDDAARVALLDALGERVDEELEGLYRHGDPAERRGVLRWIGRLADRRAPAVALAIVEDALRTNDPRLVAAALGPWALRHLDGPTLRQGVLKCVFLAIPLAGLHGLDERADAELARMLAGYVHERVAAGREASDDVWPLIDAHPPEEELAAIAAEVEHPVAERREAAAAALAARRRAATRAGSST